VRRHRTFSREGLLEKLFETLFQGVSPGSDLSPAAPRLRHVYDATRKCYLLGRDRLIERCRCGRQSRPRDRLRHRA
jgi:hypothetical protein